MTESRCGILCSRCGYRESTGCTGCVGMDTPFWGESCPEKSCCEGKAHEHCGQCPDFPCRLLRQFAYDPQQGDDGLRIEQCRKWNGEA